MSLYDKGVCKDDVSNSTKPHRSTAASEHVSEGSAICTANKRSCQDRAPNINVHILQETILQSRSQPSDFNSNNPIVSIYNYVINNVL